MSSEHAGHDPCSEEQQPEPAAPVSDALVKHENSLEEQQQSVVDDKHATDDRPLDTAVEHDGDQQSEPIPMPDLQGDEGQSATGAGHKSLYPAEITAEAAVQPPSLGYQARDAATAASSANAVSSTHSSIDTFGAVQFSGRQLSPPASHPTLAPSTEERTTPQTQLTHAPSTEPHSTHSHPPQHPPFNTAAVAPLPQSASPAAALLPQANITTPPPLDLSTAQRPMLMIEQDALRLSKSVVDMVRCLQEKIENVCMLLVIGPDLWLRMYVCY